MSDKKKYVITAITLGAIAAVSGALVGVTNLVTKDRIKQNEINKFNKGIAEIFGENSSVSEHEMNITYLTYVTDCYKVNDKDNAQIGWAVKTTGSNMYGKISLIAGFNDEKALIGTYLVVDEQTYASTLVKNYINPLNDGEDVDVHCGATYGAKLVKSMIEEAQGYLSELKV